MRNKIQQTEQEQTDRLEHFNAKALEDIAIEEQDINPHQCDHLANYLIPIDLSFDPITGNQIIRQKCMCCNEEIIDEVVAYNKNHNADKNLYRYMEENYLS